MEKIKKLKELYYMLEKILDKYGKSYHDYGIIKNRLTNILDYLDKAERENTDISNTIKELKQIHDRLYSPRGGLTDFYIDVNGKEEKEKLNNDLEILQKEIDDILT